MKGPVIDHVSWLLAATATPGKTHPVVIAVCVGVVVVLLLFIIAMAVKAQLGRRQTPS